jgi:hypothetical protein
MIINVLLLFAFIINSSIGQKVDLTLETNAVGQDVVEAVIKKLKMTKLFPKDNEFLLRLAYAETKFGNDTANSPPVQGLWNLDDSHLDATKDTVTHPELAMLHYKIGAMYGINWDTVTPMDMRKPLISGLAAHIYLKIVPDQIPATIDQQAAYWKKYYNLNAKVPAKTFVDHVTELHNSFVCRPWVDICYVLDGSGSIAPKDFELARSFVHNTTKTFFTDLARFSLIMFSTDVTVVYSLDDKKSMVDMLSVIDHLVQPAQSTNTGGAISKAVELFKTVQVKREGIAKHMLVITDGQSNYPKPGVQPGPVDAKNAGIITLAWGVGHNVNKTELKEIANFIDDDVDYLENYAQLSEYGYKYQSESCKMSQTPAMNNEVTDTLMQTEKRYYMYKSSSGTFAITVKPQSGKTISYYSFADSNPNRAMHDGNFTDTVTLHGQNILYIAVEGLDKESKYSIVAMDK